MTKIRGIRKKNLDFPDKRRTVEKGKYDIVKFGDISISRGVFEPGFKCNFEGHLEHIGFVISGKIRV
jgi:hypothetical protein